MTMVRYSLTSQARDTYRRFADLALPRHTSYPISPMWHKDYLASDFATDLAQSAREQRPLSLYVHVPFCQRLCYYCACTKEIVPVEKRREKDPAEPLLDALAVEIDRVADIVGHADLHQVHLGGGSPTFLTPAQLVRLMSLVRHRFALAADAEIAIEIDPRITSHKHLATLKQLGFNRISLGIQDFSHRVQRAVNRLQPVAVVKQVVAWCRELAFDSINFDLIYGLPFQTRESMAETLEQTIALQPDRIAFYRLAVIPEMFRWQNTFKSADLPVGDLALDLNVMAINRFQEAGYEFIGLDHFARPTEALAEARREASLHRTFQGMTTHKGLDLIGLGPSGISLLDHAYAQNRKTTEEWSRALQDGLATERGLRLTPDDRIRREVLQQLYGYGEIPKRTLEERFAIAFDDYFSAELRRLEELVEEGLVELDADRVRLTEPVGRLLVRVVGAVFDRYLPPDAYRKGLPPQVASRVG